MEVDPIPPKNKILLERVLELVTFHKTFRIDFQKNCAIKIVKLMQVN
jgi:hypothetical protein